VKSNLRHPPGPPALRAPEQQCLVRDANETAERRQARPAYPRSRAWLRCECDDPSCPSRLRLTHAEYERVRAYGSHFVVGVNHENPENACVLRENSEFAIIDVIAADDRYHVLARNPRHAWTSPPEPSVC
jgi:hypothetical protein